MNQYLVSGEKWITPHRYTTRQAVNKDSQYFFPQFPVYNEAVF